MDLRIVYKSDPDQLISWSDPDHYPRPWYYHAEDGPDDVEPGVVNVGLVPHRQQAQGRRVLEPTYLNKEHMYYYYKLQTWVKELM